MINITEHQNWPNELYDNLRKSSLCDAGQIENLLNRMLTCATNATDVWNGDKVSDDVLCNRVPPEISELNIYKAFTRNRNLSIKAKSEETKTYLGRRAQSSSLYQQITQDKLLHDRLIAVPSLEHHFVSFEEITRMHQISTLAFRVRSLFGDITNNASSQLREQLVRSKKLKPYTYEEIIWLINKKKQENPDKTVYVLMYDEWKSYFEATYASQERAKTEICGAKIIFLNEVYFGWRGGPTPGPFSAAVITEDEIQWNLYVTSFHKALKVPRRLQVIYGMGYQHYFKIL